MYAASMTPRKMYTFYIDADLAAGLKRIKGRDGVSESETIRRGLREWLRKRGALEAERRRAGTRKRS